MKKRTAILVLAVLLLTPVLSAHAVGVYPTVAPDFVPDGAPAYIVGGVANVHIKSTTNSGVLAKLEPGELVYIQFTRAGWAYILYKDATRAGWVPDTRVELKRD